MSGRRILILALADLMLMSAACTGGGAEPPLEGTNWVLTSLDGSAPGPDSSITAKFESVSGQVGGSSGCNSYGAPYQVDGDSLTIGPATGTLMACPEPLMQQESEYLAALSATASYTISGEALTLKDEAGVPRLVFAAQPQGLAGTSWKATGYNNGQEAVVSVLGGTELTADFGADGQLSGSAGCNTYNASFTTEGERIRIGPAASTRMFCGEPQGVMEQEAQYLTALTTAATYSIRGSTLELRTADGALAASFLSVP